MAWRPLRLMAGQGTELAPFRRPLSDAVSAPCLGEARTVSAAELGVEDDLLDAPDSGLDLVSGFGCFIFNFLVFIIIGGATFVQWQIGFGLAVAYGGVLVGLAVLALPQSPRFKASETLLWAMAGWCVFACGLHLTFHVLAPALETDRDALAAAGPPALPPVDNDLAKLLPAGSSGQLRAWAARQAEPRAPPYAEFEGYVFFSAAAPPGSGGGAGPALLRSNGTSTLEVRAAAEDGGASATDLQPSSFARLGADLYMLSSAPLPGELWAVSGDGARDGLARRVLRLGGYLQVGDLIADRGRLYFKAWYNCPNGWTHSVYLVDEGNVARNLRGEPFCAGVPQAPKAALPGGCADGGRPVLAWGALLAADLPMVAFAGWALRRRGLPGLCANVYYGAAIAVALLGYIILPLSALPSFITGFLVLYTGGALAIITLASVVPEHEPCWVEGAKGWVAAGAGVPFFLAIHVGLDLYGAATPAAWTVYALVAAGQVLVGVAVSRPLPMTLGVVGAAEVARHVSWTLAGGGTAFGAVVGTAALVLQGALLVAAVAALAARRGHLDLPEERGFRDAARRLLGRGSPGDRSL